MLDRARDEASRLAEKSKNLCVNFLKDYLWKLTVLARILLRTPGRCDRCRSPLVCVYGARALAFLKIAWCMWKHASVWVKFPQIKGILRVTVTK